jgi:hypothetical protein
MNFDLWDGGRCFYMKNYHKSTLEVKKSASRDLKSLEKKWSHGQYTVRFLILSFLFFFIFSEAGPDELGPCLHGHKSEEPT